MAFQNQDEDHDGKITPEEVTKAMNELGHSIYTGSVAKVTLNINVGRPQPQLVSKLEWGDFQSESARIVLLFFRDSIQARVVDEQIKRFLFYSITTRIKQWKQ